MVDFLASHESIRHQRVISISQDVMSSIRIIRASRSLLLTIAYCLRYQPHAIDDDSIKPSIDLCLYECQHLSVIMN